MDGRELTRDIVKAVRVKRNPLNWTKKEERDKVKWRKGGKQTTSSSIQKYFY